MTLLEVRNLSAGYGVVQVLDNVSLTVEAGEAVVVLGANGAGKTTLLRALSGVIESDGDILWNGERRGPTRADQWVELGMVQVPQGRGTLVALTVEENLRMGGYHRHHGEVTADIHRWFDVFPRLAERRHQRAGSLSGGEQQMLAIARAFMANPSLLLLDEPSQGLAPLVIAEVFDRLREAVSERGTAVLLVEQNANLALEFASRGYLLETGEIVGSGTAADIRSDDRLRAAYLGG